jgi:hypothetical protein
MFGASEQTKSRRLFDGYEWVALSRITAMIYCVVPKPLAGELLDRLTSYYAEDPNVTVIVDRRISSRRENGNGAAGGKRALRDRRRPRIPGEMPALAVD